MKKIIKSISVIALLFTFSVSVVGTSNAGDPRDIGHKAGDRGH
jgi:acid phosphatase class B